jgi:REP element-mobilizing transposase RayT
VAETFAWVLMKNHFHLLVRVKEVEEIKLASIDLTGFQNLSGLKMPQNLISQQFSNLFNAYSKAFNKMYHRTGSLFQRPFHRIEVTSDLYFKHLIVYIHTNPVHHGFTEYFKDYPWSSYGTILSIKPTKLSREKVIGWFDDKANFMEVHKQKIDLEAISRLLLE